MSCFVFWLMACCATSVQAARYVNVEALRLVGGCVDVNKAPIGGSNGMRNVQGIGNSLAQALKTGRPYATESDVRDVLGQNGSKASVYKSSDGKLCLKGARGAPRKSKKPKKQKGSSRSESPASRGGSSRSESPSSAAVQPAQSLAQCDEMKKVPPLREVAESPASETILKNMRIATYGPGHKFKILAQDKIRKDQYEACLNVFPHVAETPSFPTSSDVATFNQSIGVCILTNQGSQKRPQWWPLEYSEYNNNRNVPNFVAYKVLGKAALHDSTECRRQWKPVCPKGRKDSTLALFEKRCNGVVDFHFKTGKLHSKDCFVHDSACARQVDSRGHMSPVKQNAWSLDMCASSMMFVNVFPSRQPFDGAQWAQRERRLVDYLQAKGADSAAWVVVGTSRESDGTIQSLRKSKDPQEVEVPSFIWTAIFDETTKKATGWLCRNGLRDTDPCFCVDKLSVAELEQRVGHKIFPQLENMGMVNLTDGSHPEYWSNFYEQ